MAACLVALTAPASAPALPSVPLQRDWVVDGEVRAIARAGGTTYIGGTFTRIGARTGHVVKLSPSTGERDTCFPVIGGGAVQAIEADGAGGYFVGGSFNDVGGQPRSRLAHIKSDCTLDQFWNPNPNGTVRTIKRVGNTLYIGGDFTMLGVGNGAPVRNRAASLNATTGAPTSWNPNLDSNVNDIDVDSAAGVVYLGGTFTTVGGQARNRLAAVSTDGTMTAWNPDVNGDVYTLREVGASVYAGGAFTTVGGQPRQRLAAVSKVDGSPTTWAPAVNDAVFSIALSGSKLYVGGLFTSFDASSRSRIAAVDLSDPTNPTLAPWNPGANGAVYEITEDFPGGATVYVGGEFTTIGGQPRRRVAMVDRTTGNATAWDPSANGAVRAIHSAGTGIYVGGDLTSVGGVTRDRIAALNADGSPTPWTANANGPIYALAVDASNVYAGGNFTSIGGAARQNLAALSRATGSATLAVDANGAVHELALAGTTLYVGGDFATIGGQARNRIASLTTGNGAVTSWNPDANGSVRAIAPAGPVTYVGGLFTSIGGQARNYIAAIDNAGAATPWNPDANGAVHSIAVPQGGPVYAGGEFTTIGGQVRNRLAAIAQASGVPTGWAPAADGTVFSLAVYAPQGGGSTVYAAGSFTSITSGGPAAQRNRLAAIDAATGSPSSWNPSATAVAYAIASAGSAVLVGGAFTDVNTRPTGSYAEFNGGPQNTQPPSILGQPKVGQTVTCTTGSWTNNPTSYLYEWRRSGVPLPGPSGTTYTLTEADVQKQITCRVTAVNGDGQTSATSQAIVPLPLPPVNVVPPSIEGIPQVGQKLHCVRGTWQPQQADFSREWRLNGVPIPGATGPEYELTPADAGGLIVCVVKASNAGGANKANSEPVRIHAPKPPDAQAPTVTITSGPPASTREIMAVFTFTADEAEVGFECRLNGGPWAACGSPNVVYGLSLGQQTFEVRATDRAGNTGQASSWIWGVDQQPPSLGKVSIKAGKRLSRRSLKVLSGVAGSSADDVARVMIKLEILGKRGRLDGKSSGADGNRCVYLSLKTGHRTAQRCGKGFTGVEGTRHWTYRLPAAARRGLRSADRYRLLIRTRDEARNTEIYNVKFRVG